MNSYVKGVLLCLMIIGSTHAASFKNQIVQLNNHPSHLVTWGDSQDKSKRPLILLSGPIDSWHSDSAWWATVGQPLSKDYRVFALDRQGIATGNADAEVGYLPLADDVSALIRKYHLVDPVIVAFASSNLTVMRYLQKHNNHTPVKAVVMIDPDVLTEFSIARYASDAKPFKENLEKYLTYIGEGKYVPRVKQKNEQDKMRLERLANNQFIEWPLVNSLFKKRLEIVSQQNQFKEIASYENELNQVADIPWPSHLPLLIFDTQFEQGYIDHSKDPDVIKGLHDWQQDGKQYYQRLAKTSDQGIYIEVGSKAHLLQVEKPQFFITKLSEFLNRL